MIRYFFLLTIGLASSHCLAQDYHVKRYRVDDGLPSDIVKGCAQDSLGYFWIATDDGIVKYDGIRFITYRDQLRSGYAKGFFKSRRGRFFAFSDLDLVEIRNLGDTVIFNPLAAVARSPDDHTISYPKAVFEDMHGDLWISESQSVVRLRGREFKRFSFLVADRSPQFLRSFTFFEDARQDLFVTSFPGNVFKFDPVTETFQPISVKLPFGIEHASTHNGHLLIGCSSGFFDASLLPAGGFDEPVLKLKAPLVSYIEPLPNQQYLVATRGTTHFIADRDKEKFAPLSQSINNINHVYLSSDGDLWLSGNDGLILLKENLFHQASELKGEFIEAITEDPQSEKIYYATGATLIEFDRKENKNKTLLNVPSGYFQSLLFSPEGIWAANAFAVLLIKDDKIIRRFNLSNENYFVLDITKDSKGNLWFAQPGQTFAFMIDPVLQLHKFRVPLGREGIVNLVREGDDGVYVGSTGKSSYIFMKSNGDTAFRNISVPVQFPTHGDFTISDLVFMNNNVWLASSEGLLRFDKKSITRVDLGTTFTGLAVKSIEVYQKTKLLLTNVFGLILYDPASQTYSLFNESTGMLSNTITARGLFIGHDNAVWLGTSKGLCFTPATLDTAQKTPMPRIVEFTADGKDLRPGQAKAIPYGSFITAVVSSITFPETEVMIQYRLKAQSEWRALGGPNVTFSNLDAGKYLVEIRAKKNGPFTWSDTALLSFTIGKPFWSQTWFYLACVFAAGFLIITSIVWANIRNNKRRKELELLIDERTNALRITNEELSLRNNELDRFVYSASHDLSAPLKSILGLISVAQMEKPSPEINQYLDLMRRSVLKLDSFIRDIISYSRNSRLPVRRDPIAISALIESVWADHQFTPNVDKIQFEIVNNVYSELLSDETRLKIVFNNLISNAIKFHKLHDSPYIRICADESDDCFEFKVEDNGIGIEATLKDKIFDMFFRATESVQGSGLGLYILKETISRLGGHVTVESSLGQGTTFTVTLPK